MGMSSSQARLLSLTSRMHSIEYKAQNLEAQKLQMANESSHVYKEYENALNQTKIQYKSIGNDGSVLFKDASYYELCMYGGGAKNQYALVDTDSGKLYVSNNTKTTYENSTSASNFALTMSGLTEIPKDSSDTTGGTTGGGSTSGSGSVDSTDKTEITPDKPATLNMKRGETKTLTATDDGVILCLENPFDKDSNKKYYYNIKSNTGADNNIKLQYLENGRLIISGNDYTLDAYSGQEDDLIINGHNNIINTGDKDDLIRLGMSRDQSGILHSSETSGLGGSSMLSELENSSENNTYNNTIIAGSGDDYIYDNTGGLKSSSSSSTVAQGNTINGGGGNDAYRNGSVSLVNKNSSIDFSPDTIYKDYNTVSNVEDNYVNSSKKTASTNSQLESFGQGNLGDCRFISLLTSLKNNGKSLSSLGITITNTSSGYNVKFAKYPGGSKTVSVSNSELYEKRNQESYYLGDTNTYASGDLDARIVEYAINKSIKLDSGRDLSTTSYQEYSRYLFGNDKVSYYISSKSLTGGTIPTEQIYVDTTGGAKVGVSNKLVVSKELIQALWNKYQNGSISNLEIGTDDGINGYSDTLQLCNNHAYSIYDVQDNYVTLINPWDNADKLKLGWSDFLKYCSAVTVYGDTSSDEYTNLLKGNDLYNGTSLSITNSESTTEVNENNEETNNNDFYYTNIYIGAGSTDTAKYNYYLKLYNLIKEANGCITVPDSMLGSSEYLVNMLNGGNAYLKMYNQNEKEWIDTNVATNTGLQEVSDEIKLKKAEAKYEADMRKINQKDKKFDTEIAALESERNAISTEMDTLKNVAKDNIDRTFKLFS